MLEVTVDVKDAPDLAHWGEKTAKLCVDWYPQLVALLPSEGFRPAKRVRLVLSPLMKDAAHAVAESGAITISAHHVRAFPEDWGMVIHELTHIVQSYPPGGPGWLVEGIADYVRIVHFEPGAPRPKLDRSKASYQDGYKTTAMFLEWIERQHGVALVRLLNAALRQQKYRENLFQEITGRTLAELWLAFAATLPP